MIDTSSNEAFEPMGKGTIETPPASADLQPAAPLKSAHAEFEGTAAGNWQPGSSTGEAKQMLKDNAAKLGDRATDKARGFAEDGKARAAGALNQLSGMLNDAATQVDEKLGSQYGEYARGAADRVSAFSSDLEGKDVDALVADAREFVRKSPAIAIGAAAAIGFVVARLVTSGFDQREEL